MRRIALILFLAFALQGSAAAYNGDVLVYVTNTGECYHRDGCSYLKSRIEMTLENAVSSGYYGCSRCSPPELGIDSEYDAYSYDEYRHRNDKPEEPKAEPEPSPPIVETREEENNWWNYILIGASVLFFTPVGWIVLEFIAEARDKAKKKALPASALTRPSLPCPPNPKKEVIPFPPEGTVEKYRGLLEGKSVWELAGVPDWAYFDGHDFPHTLQGKTDEPDPFIVYVTESGACYHKPGCHMAKGGKPVNICEAKQHGKCACSVCKPMEQLPDFVVKYQRIKNIQRAFGIKMLP